MSPRRPPELPDLPDLDAMRARAEELLAQRDAVTRQPTQDPATLIHELDVYRVELEMQNEELRDVLDRLQLEHDRYFELFDAAPVAYLMLSPTGAILDANLAACHLFECSRPELLNTSLLFRVDLSDHGGLHDHLNDVFEARPTAELSLSLKPPASNALLVHSALMERGCLMTLTDITELRRAEALLDAARRQAERQDQAKSQFVAMVSHEIRTPLTSVLAYSDLLLRLFPDHPGNDQLQLISTAARRMTALVNDVLDLAKVEAESIELHPHAFQPGELGEYALRTTAPAAQTRHIEMSLVVDPTAQLTLLGDSERLTQCVLNLCNNALKFAPEGGRVRVSIAYRSGTLVVMVEDDGPGVPDDEKEAVFRPYKQLDSSDSRQHGGVGLGLAITRRLTELMRGQILVGDSPLGGARFVLQIPFAAERLAPVPHPAPAAAQHRQLGQGPLLVVDDDADIRDLLAALLTHLGHPFELATSGQEALDLLTEREFCAVLLDMQMPQLDGIEVVRRIRRANRPRHLPVAALTAKVLAHEIDACLAAGCDVHIAKPIGVESLQAGLEELLGS